MWVRHIKSRQGVWVAIRKLRTFTCRDIYVLTGHETSSIRSYLDRLAEHGYLEKKTIGKIAEPNVYTLVRDVGQLAPRIDKDGKPMEPSARQRIWSALRVFGAQQFDARYVALVAFCELGMAKEYLKYLRLSGYIKVAQESYPGKGATYIFLPGRNSGPLAPEVNKRKQQVFDPNAEKIVWRGGAA